MQKNRIYNIDCLDGLQKIKSKTVKTLIADPPYFLGMTHNGKKGAFVDLAIMKPFYLFIYKEIKRILKDDGAIYWFCDFRSYAWYYQVLADVFNITNVIVWNKQGGAGNKYGFYHEFVIFITNDKKFNIGGSNVWDIYGFGNPKARSEFHYERFQKPIKLIDKMIKDTTKAGDLVVDPFSGTGTTAISARQLNRDFIGFELDAKNFDTIKKRFSSGISKPLFIDV